ncbi:MAG: pyridoxamine 5'-phosphate oxidase family protein [Nitrosopumilaceae archaeon]|nr:pyridoxamine 5'-phosphate oxidase family protein [Nitrosopumilaceae archaeon]
MASLTPEMVDYLNRLKLGFVATVSPDNTPNVSPKGTIIPWGEEHLVFADIKSPQTMKNLQQNPSIEINVVDPLLRRGYRFKGTATILSDGDEFTKIITHYKETGIKSEILSVVKIKLDEIREVVSPLYDLGMTEHEIKDKWKKLYSDF